MSHDTHQPPATARPQEPVADALHEQVVALHKKVHALERDTRVIQDTLRDLGEALAQAARAFS